MNHHSGTGVTRRLPDDDWSASAYAGYEPTDPFAFDPPPVGDGIDWRDYPDPVDLDEADDNPEVR
jgi:hypothetical protein